MEIREKLNRLKEILKDMEKVAVAFSGGVDSTFLLKVAHDVLGDGAVAITARSLSFPEREYRETVEFTKKHGIKHIVIDSKELEKEEVYNNSVDRCYYCKYETFSKMFEVLKLKNIKYLLEGSNVDDLSDYRPGLRAIEELKVLSPLKMAGFKKDDIRELSREMNLPTWDKPSFACLSSRFPYGHKITAEKLKMVEEAEEYLLDLGFRQVRVRHHGDIARIEVAPNERLKLLNEKLMDDISDKFSKIGFIYTALDLKGYRTGSMNQTLDLKSK
ncbi:ATP-dependent sacrificial sulfur transferase LarE [Acetivibrio saccincola]|uniref:GMP synthase subunit B n=1 Tax=Acetivibrio saccincola TaxID=1677857 RepID=A0A2K9E0U7_9FIRM|nr:ATP-dependent sacrificial sulfur transferase LarE [Acetivibrio saccincola]AUG57402.1 GMP synthase subunit B [Acetivibrio saccincola]NLW26596.1 ATP-dependent sacrificial sulfur transferase LarE [Acetivibrio saccincola]PQQ67328.1 TIGR00268 family protein [Acetivibrio saccincola]HOA96197.1 ATP-dependent sacrificial sulfur transferase LarE [Acetivibrio saccincola]HQD29616.1 ATP-dependent sacrificial sulfur transferase LarE [Acetivibrio saccincola]